MATTSPKWKKPADTMMLRQSKKKGVTSLKRRHLTTNHSPHDSPNLTGNSAAQSQKRRNPFSCPKKKRINTGGSDVVQECVPNALFEVLDAAAKDAEGEKNVNSVLASSQCGPDKVLKNISLEEIIPLIEPTHIPTTHSQEKDENETINWTDWFPADWSLKRKLRFVSDKSFSWCCPLRTAEEAAGVSSFVRCQSTNTLELPQLSEQSNAQAELHRCCMVWSHPHLPWFNLFPRIVPDNRIGKVCPALQMEDVQKALMADWAESFTSVFRLVRARHCPYFYMCTHQMTVLFRAAGIAGFQHTHTIVTPTSRGFREALKKEGIEFSMPLNERKKEKAEDERSESPDTVTPELTDDTDATTGERRSEDDDEEDIMQSDDGAHSWLQDLGLDKSQFRSLDPNKVKLERETFRVIDRRPESLVLVEGADTFALFNYLLNCHSCVASTGVQAGLPPTLLAPVAFKGSTLETLKVKQCAVRQQQGSRTMQLGHSLEVTGPVLPHNVDRLNRLLTYSHSYTCVYSTHEPTVPFNCVSGHDVDHTDGDAADVTHNLKHSGISSEHLANITSGKMRLGNRALREFVCDVRGLYHWVL